MKDNIFSKEQEDVSIIIELLGEYSSKLDNLAEQWNNHKKKIYSLIYFWLIFLILLFAGYMTIREKINSYYSPVLLVGVILLSMLPFVQLINSERQNIKKIVSNMQVYVSRLEKLIRKGSQIEEHVEQDRGQLLELDLRLAEAEYIFQLVNEITA